MNNIIKFLLIINLITSCSLHKNSKFWTTEKVKLSEKVDSTEIFAKEAKQNLGQSIKKAASKLHHSSNVSKKSYLNNEIVELYLHDIKKFKKIIDFFRKTNGNLPSINRLLNLILKMLN